MDGIERLAKAVERLVEGGAESPTGLEALVVAISGDGLRDGSLAGAINRLADSMSELAGAINGAKE